MFSWTKHGHMTRCDTPYPILSTAMTWGMTAIGYIDTKNFSLAYSNFNRSFANVQSPFNVVRESRQPPTTPTTRRICSSPCTVCLFVVLKSVFSPAFSSRVCSGRRHHKEEP